MACCGGDEAKRPITLLQYLLASSVTALFNAAFVPLLLVAALLLPRYRAPARFYLGYLRATAGSLLSEPDVSPRLRARLVARLLRLSPPAGGLVHRRFPALCLAAAFGVALGAAVIVIGALGRLA